MLFQNIKLNRLLIGSMVVALAVPLINVFLIYPHFSKLQVNSIEDSAIRLAQHIERELLETSSWPLIIEGESPTPADKILLNNYMADFGLQKMKIFSEKGVTVYSTDKSDIGELNTNNYFHEFVAKGQVFSKVVKKESKSLEGQTYPDDVAEVYVPTIQNNKFTSAFEFYYNISQHITSLERLIWYASILPFAVSGFLLLALYWGFRNLDHSLTAREKAEAEIKVLQGIIPICMYCKEIRDDDGYWNRIEAYIETHSEAHFSHGICDSCLESEYGKELANQIKESTTES